MRMSGEEHQAEGTPSAKAQRRNKRGVQGPAQRPVLEAKGAKGGGRHGGLSWKVPKGQTA